MVNSKNKYTLSSLGFDPDLSGFGRRCFQLRRFNLRYSNHSIWKMPGAVRNRTYRSRIHGIPIYREES